MSVALPSGPAPARPLTCLEGTAYGVVQLPTPPKPVLMQEVTLSDGLLRMEYRQDGRISVELRQRQAGEDKEVLSVVSCPIISPELSVRCFARVALVTAALGSHVQ